MEDLQLGSSDDQVPEVLSESPLFKLHFVQGFYSQDFQPEGKERHGSRTKHEAKVLLDPIINHYLVVAIERAKLGRQFEKVGAEKMRLEFAKGLFHREGKKHQLPGERSFVFGFGCPGVFDRIGRAFV